MTQTFTVTIDTPIEYRGAIMAADALGFIVKETRTYGTWEAHTEGNFEPIFLHDTPVDVESVGTTYFHFRFDGETYKCRAVPGNVAHDGGELDITFEEFHD